MPKDETAVENHTSLVERMFNVGAHFGYSRSRRHPSVAAFIFGTKNRAEVIDLEKTGEMLERAKSFVRELGLNGKVVLFVGGKHEAREIVTQGAQSIGVPFVAGRWIGGTITNFSEIKKRIERLEELKAKRESGEFQTKYTKLERLMIDREIEDLTVSFAGLLPLKTLPAALFVIDPRHEVVAVAEAKKMKVPVIALLNSDCDATNISYPIVANDAAPPSIRFFVGEIVNAYKEGGAKRQSETEKAQPEVRSE